MRCVVVLVSLALLACHSPAPAKRPIEEPVVASTSTPVAAPIADRACEDVRFPPAGGSVLVIPGETMTRALAPVVRAVCSCSRSGDRVRVTAVIVPEGGTVTATVHDDAAIDACARRELDGRFAAFEIGTDCIDCGPKRYSSRPPPPSRSRVTYPFTLVHP